MKLIKPTSKKVHAQPKTLRTLSTDECRMVSGDYGQSCYYALSEGQSASFASRSSNKGAW